MWAVAGFRMGEFALRELGLPRGSFDLEVSHHTPQQVQYSCMADGEAVATGASLGKLNLILAEAAPAETHTVFKRRSTGQSWICASRPPLPHDTATCREIGWRKLVAR